MHNIDPRHHAFSENSLLMKTSILLYALDTHVKNRRRASQRAEM